MPKLRFTLKAWPVIAIATIGLCYTTQAAAKLFGVELPDQANLEIVRKCLEHAFDSARSFWVASFLILQVVVIMPIFEEFIFRLPTRWLRRWYWWMVSAALFSAAHYLFQPWPDAAFLALFFFGLAQCWLYSKTKCIWCAVLNHALFNLSNLILLFLLPESI